MNCGKWIVAQDAPQMEALEKVHSFASSIGVPTYFVSREEGKRREPDVRAEAGILESPSTGILDSHSLMQFLEGDFESMAASARSGPQSPRSRPSATAPEAGR